MKSLVEDLPGRPRGIVAVTPHVRTEYVSLAAEGVVRRSFPRRFVERVGDIGYAPPPATELAARVRGHPDDGALFNVVLYALGAAVGNGKLAHAEALNLGWEFGSFSARDYVFG